MKRNLNQFSKSVYDVLVIGGGVYGLFVAWDAALRGLAVALVDKGDFGHANSSKARIIHGGFRYLRFGELPRARQSIHERMVFMKIAPHLVHPLPFLIPTYASLKQSKELLSLALLANEVISADRNRLEDPQKYLPGGRIISKEECLRLLPGLEPTGLTGGAIYYDCQMYSPERFVVALAQSTAKAGVDLANYVEAHRLLNDENRVVGVRAKDVLTGDDLEIRARVAVNASGPWLNRVLDLLPNAQSICNVGLSKAFNLLVQRPFAARCAICVHSEEHNAILGQRSRHVFITPWQGRAFIGTAHLPYDAADPDRFELTQEDVQRFLDEINRAYPAAGLKLQEVCLAYGGLLPTVKYRTGDALMMRRYRIHDHQEEGLEGLISVIGARFTEARHVAEKVVDLAFKKLGNSPPKSTTTTTPVHGGHIARFDDFLAQEIQRRPQGLSPEIVRQLIYHYGSAYLEALKYVDNDPALAQTISDGIPVIQAEILHGIREEMAQKLTDVIFRRTELGRAGNPGDSCLETCAALMAKELSWDKTRIDKELKEAKKALSLGVTHA